MRSAVDASHAPVDVLDHAAVEVLEAAAHVARGRDDRRLQQREPLREQVVVERAEAAAKAATPEEVAALDPDAPKEGEEGEEAIQSSDVLL